MRLPRSESSRKAAWPSQVSVAMRLLSREGREHRRTVRSEREAVHALARRLLPALLVVLAAFADSRGAHGLAFYALLGAVPFAAVAAIAAFGEQLDSRGDAVAAMQALLWGLVVVLLVVSCWARGAALPGAPPLAISTVVGCLGVFAIKVVLAAAPYARRLAELLPAKP